MYKIFSNLITVESSTNLCSRKSGHDKHIKMARDTTEALTQYEFKTPVTEIPSPPPPLKILFLSSDTGGGHRASAESLAAQFLTHYPNSTYQILDICKDLASPPFSRLESWYSHLSSHPSQWNMLYKVSNMPTVESILAFHFQITLERKVRNKIQSLNPDVVISVHPLMNLVPTVSCHKISSETGRHLPMFTVVTDLGSGHCTWFEKGVEKMFIASEQIRQLAKTRGNVPEDKIMMSGLPIRKDFATQADNIGIEGRSSSQGRWYQEQIRLVLGLSLETRDDNISDGQLDFFEGVGTSQFDTNTTEMPVQHPIIMVIGGGEGVGSLSSIVNALYLELYAQQRSATILVVCGRNETLRQSLEDRDWEALVQNGVKASQMSPFQKLNPLRVFQTENYKVVTHKNNRRQWEYKFEEEKKSPDENDELAKDIDRSKYTASGIIIHPLGFISNMAEYMVASDLLISKAGPGTIAEAAAVGLPVLLTSFLPGQEEGNVDVVIQNKFGGFVADTNPSAVARKACEWLKNKDLMDEMSSHAMRAGVPNAAEDIVKCIGTSVCRWKELHEEMN